jgi:hypothetical protein
VIQEEIQRAKKSAETPVSETFGIPVAHVKHSGTQKSPMKNEAKIQELEREIIDLKIANRGKDYFIELMKLERNEFFEKIQAASRVAGQMEVKLHQLGDIGKINRQASE